MGQAKRRKQLGDYPAQTPKPRGKARRKVDPMLATIGMINGIQEGIRMNQVARMFDSPRRKDGRDG
ncbi:MAG TPA: hypothetical protein IAA29_00665 [Candidatus Paenibacillus intestinavium]|nr:hypothetical protein [Candidatus Paenibacillus intestinavium]